MNHKRNVLLIILIAAIFTAFLYWIDSDPTYPNVWHTVIEFAIWTFLISGILGIFYVGPIVLRRILKKI